MCALSACISTTHLNHGDSTVDKGCRVFTRNLVTALWHCSVFSLFNLLPSDSLNGVVTAETAASLMTLFVSTYTELSVLKKDGQKNDS